MILTSLRRSGAAWLAAVALLADPLGDVPTASGQDDEPTPVPLLCSTEAATAFAGGLYGGLLARGEEISPRALERIPPPSDPCASTFYWAAATAIRDQAPPQLEPGMTVVDCSLFPTWQQAQVFFMLGGGPFTDYHGLDPNRDGIACDSLPGSPMPR